jgi:radical SAM protein with 4Fe4S-binding SPASM domain
MAHLDVGDMDFELFKKILGDIRPFTNWNTSLSLVGLGEPLMYPKLEEAITYAKMIYPQFPINLNTNGVLLDSDRSYALTRSMGKGDCICISLNAGNKDTYTWLMGVNKYDIVVNNTKQFLSIRKTDRSGQKLKVIIQIMRTKNTGDTEIREFKKFWAPFLLPHDEVSVKSVLNWSGKIDVDSFRLSREKIKRYPCLELWTSVAIDKTGNVYPCCEGFSSRKDSQLILGNVSQRPLAETYSDRIDYFRSAHLKDEYELIPECARCDFYTDFPNVWIRNRLPLTVRKWF